MSWTVENPVAYRFHQQWKSMVGWASSYIELLTDEELRLPVIPGKNHGIWVLGHLIESEDELSKYLGRDPMLFPNYEALFGMKTKLQPPSTYPAASDLRMQWKQVCAKNDAMLQTIRDSEWDEPHALIEGDPKDDFYGTKGRCIHLWILHQNYHVGQLALMLSQQGKSIY